MRLAAILLTGAVLTCASPRIAEVTLLGLGDPCSPTTACRAKLVCDAGFCAPTGEVPRGGECVITGDCQPDLYCAAGSCANAGSSPEGGPCAGTADCQAGLWCNFAGFGGICSAAGAEDVGERCGATADCAAGLVCDPSTARCASSFAEPWGQDCTDDSDCAAEQGIVCDTATSLCKGLGPDGTPLVPWMGAECADTNELSGDFRVLFELPYGNGDFYALPFPNDIRVGAGGRVDYSGHPKPPVSTVPPDLLGRYIDAAEAEQEGWGPNQTVFMRWSGPPKFCADNCGQGSNPACANGCMGPGEPEQTIYVADLTRDTNGDFPASPFTPLSYNWLASSGRSTYLCWNWLAVVPAASTPWRPGHTYLVFVHSRVRGAGNETMRQDEDFATMLFNSSPGGQLAAAWDAYEPLRAWLATSPTYPSSSTAVQEADLGGAALFTIRDTTRPLVALADAVAASAVPAVSAVVDCEAASPPADCADASALPFRELRGRIALPTYQSGTAPYVSTGGAIVLDAGGAVEQGTASVRFALTVPDDAPEPAGGWPVVIYAHGTGGDYRSHIEDGTAELLALAAFGGNDTPFAVLGIDQNLHGERTGGGALGSDALFFNFANPAAARGNVLQAAAEQLALERSIDAIATAAAVSLDSAHVGYLGHSQGGIVGTLALARSAIPAAVLSGAGGGLIDTLTRKRSPYDIATIIRMVLADPALDDGRTHPALSLMQGYLEEADPLNYGPMLSSAPLAGGSAKHLLYFVGVGDTYTPNSTAISLARRIGVGWVDTSPASGLLRSGDTAVTLPTDGNRAGFTRVVSMHSPAAGEDGHFVLFDDAKAGERAASFFSSWLTDPQNVPTVVP